jgi:hypothetical protein
VIIDDRNWQTGFLSDALVQVFQQRPKVAADLSDLTHRQRGQHWYHVRMTQKRKASKTSKKLFVGSGKKLTQESVKSLHKLQGSRRQPKGGSLARSGKRYD